MDEVAVTHLFDQPLVEWVGTFAGALFKSEATGRNEVQSEELAHGGLNLAIGQLQV